MSALATDTIVRNDIESAEDQCTTSTMPSSEQERRLSGARRNSEEFNEEERAPIDRALRIENGDMAVRQHCKPIVYHTNIVED